MSKIHVTPALFESKFQIAPAEIVFHRSISSDTKILILAINQIKHSAPSWTIIQSDLQNRLCFGRDKMKKAMAEAVQFGYLRVKQVRQEKGKVNAKGQPIAGQFNRNDFDFNIDGNFEIVDEQEKDDKSNGKGLSLEASEPSTEKPSTAKPSTVNQPLPMPDKPMPRLKALKGNASLSKSSRALEASPVKKDSSPSKARKHKRTEDHENKFQYLLGLQILDDNGYLNEDDMSYLSFKYSQKQIDDAYYHMLYKMEKKDFKARNPLAVFKFLLKNEHNARGANSDINATYARKIKSEFNWTSLEIKEKYVIDKNNSAKDISLNMEPSAFRDSLGGLLMGMMGQ